MLVLKHKQILLPIATIIVGFALFFGLSSLKKPPAEKEQKRQPTSVTIETVQFKPLTMQIDSFGEIQAQSQTHLVAQVSGKITFVSDAFNRGRFVKKGELLAIIEKLDYQSMLIEAEANLAAAEASLELEKAQGKVAKDEWQKINNISPSELSLRKPQLAKEIASVKAAKAGLQRAKNNLMRTEIRAPYSALIEERTISLGSVVNNGTQLGSILGTDVAEVRLPVANKQLAYLQRDPIGSTVSLSTSNDTQQTWQAKIVREEGVIDEQSRMTYFVARVDDPYSLKTTLDTGLAPSSMSDKPQTPTRQPLRFGTYVTAKITGATLSEAAEIPLHLISTENSDQRVAIMDQHNKLELRPVQVFRKQAQTVIVTGGLENGDQLITSTLRFPVSGTELVVHAGKKEPEASRTTVITDAGAQ